MSVLQRMLPCPCRTWRCRLFYAGRVLAVLAANGAELFIAVKLGWL